MEKPNQAMRQTAQEEVRSQGSEVVYFIDRVLPTSYNPATKPDLGFASVPSTGQGRERDSRTSKGPQKSRAAGWMWEGAASQGGAGEGLALGAGPGTPRGSARPGQPLTPPLKVRSGSQ